MFVCVCISVKAAASVMPWISQYFIVGIMFHEECGNLDVCHFGAMHSLAQRLLWDAELAYREICHLFDDCSNYWHALAAMMRHALPNKTGGWAK